MMTPISPTTTRRLLTRGIPPILLGMALFLLGLLLGRPLDGFVGGMFDGATITLMILGAYLLGDAMWGNRDADDDRGWWLPSRDGTASPDRQPSDGDDPRGGEK